MPEVVEARFINADLVNQSLETFIGAVRGQVSADLVCENKVQWVIPQTACFELIFYLFLANTAQQVENEGSRGNNACFAVLQRNKVVLTTTSVNTFLLQLLADRDGAFVKVNAIP